MATLIHISRKTQPLARQLLDYRANHAAQRAYQDYKAGEYRLRNEKDWREARRASVQKHRHKLRDLCFQLLGGPKCVRCGFDDRRALQFDHIDGTGTKHRDRVGPQAVMYDIVKWGLAKYQVLCANCNWIKRSEDREEANFDKRGTKKEAS